MKIVGFALICLAWAAPATASDTPASKPFRIAMMCFKSGEQTSGMNKICFYNCAGSNAAITISSIELCPLSIDR